MAENTIHFICEDFVIMIEFFRNRPGGRRRGYMGHLTKIANTINEHREKGPNSDRIKELFQGEGFCLFMDSTSC